MTSKGVRVKRNRIIRLFSEQDGLCFYCDKPFTRGRKATQEHLQRVTDGGTYSRINIVLACKPCNHGRGDHPSRYWKLDQYRKRVFQLRIERTTTRRIWKQKHLMKNFQQYIPHKATARLVYNRFHSIISRYYLTKGSFVVIFMRLKYRNIVGYI